MDAVVEWVGPGRFRGRAGEKRWVPLEASPKYGGTGQDLTPMEMVVVGLGGCTGLDVASLLEKQKVKLDRFWIELHAEKAEEHPQVFTRIHMKYIFVGKNIPADKVERAIALSTQKYCSVGAMLKATAKIEHEYEIKSD
jgi:putative redox protein